VLKVNNDLERIGDHAVAIAERAVVLAGLEPVPRPEDFDTLVDTVQRMMKDSLTALIERDADLARAVCEMDDEVDACIASCIPRCRRSCAMTSR
jgi:phosphate transport system protein